MQKTARSLCFFLLVLSSDLVIASACSRFVSLCFIAGYLSFLHAQVIKLVSIRAIQSKIKISIEIKALLYYGLIANSDQSFNYYNPLILSRVVR